VDIIYLAPTAIEADPEAIRRDVGDVSGLAETLRSYGLLQPLGVVEYQPNRFRIVYGGRRLSAAIELGLEQVACLRLPPTGDSLIMQQATENIQRLDLNDMEQAEAFRRIRDLHAAEAPDAAEGELDERTGRTVGVAARTVRRYLGLLQLPPEVQQLIRDGDLTVTHAQHLRRINQPQAQLTLARLAVDEGLSAAEVSNLANYFAANPTITVDAALEALQSKAEAPSSVWSGPESASPVQPQPWQVHDQSEDDDQEKEDLSDLDDGPTYGAMEPSESRTRSRVFRIKSLDQMVDETERLTRTYQDGELQKWVTADDNAALKVRLLARQLRSFMSVLEGLAGEYGWDL